MTTLLLSIVKKMFFYAFNLWRPLNHGIESSNVIIFSLSYINLYIAYMHKLFAATLIKTYNWRSFGGGIVEFLSLNFKHFCQFNKQNA